MAAASEHIPSGLADQWCGTERASDFKPGWFPQARPQVKVVYAFAKDQAGEFQEFSHLIQRDIKAALEMVGDESGGRRSIAFDLGTECGPAYVDITSIPLARDSGYYMQMWGSRAAHANECAFTKLSACSRSVAIRHEVRTALDLDPDGADDRLGLGGKRNFAVYVNIGPLDRTLTSTDARGDIPGCPMGSSHPSCQPDDQPGPGNKANDGGYWGWVWEQLGLATGWPNHTPRGHLAMLHEITHNLGAVQNSARHASSFHCTDGRDVMCRGVAADPFPCDVEKYDCNKDDYFNASGPVYGKDGKQIWNVADSVFTCRYDNSFSERACVLRPRLFVATRDNGLWARDAVLSNVDWQLIGHANNVIAMAAADSKLFAITRDNGLWARDMVLWNVNWRLIGSGPPNNAVAMAAAPGLLSDKLFAATSDNKLWVRDSFSPFSNLGNGGWQLIGHANNIAAMAALPELFGKLFAATRDNRLWARDPVLSDVNWELIGHANNVAAMAATDGKLFAATHDNGLWARDPVLFDVNWELIGHANNVAAMAPAPRR